MHSFLAMAQCILLFSHCPHLLTQAASLKESIAKLREKITNKENETPESIRESFGELQKSSLKLFELAYKKVCVVFLCM